MKNEKYIIEGMSCGHCAMAVKKELASLPFAEMTVEIGSAEVKYDETQITSQKITAAIEEAGYKVVSIINEQ
ncbi:MAG: heavy-metal-associated domain-containing protein [Ignavibacteriaceae bacterium]|nr:heavy-metal-associated domain-containing protein [Ignavibacteriaceae bacterium]